MKCKVGHLKKDKKGKWEQIGVKLYNILPSKDDIVSLGNDIDSKYYKVLNVLHKAYKDDDFNEKSEPDLFVEEINSPFEKSKKVFAKIN